MEPIRLDKRLSALLGIPRGEARRYIEGGWVTVNGEVVEQPQRPVDDSAVIVVAEQASDERPSGSHAAAQTGWRCRRNPVRAGQQ